MLNLYICSNILMFDESCNNNESRKNNPIENFESVCCFHVLDVGNLFAGFKILNNE